MWGSSSPPGNPPSRLDHHGSAACGKGFNGNAVFLYRSNKPEAVHLVDALLAGDPILGGVRGVGLAKHGGDGEGTEEEGEHGD